MIEFENIVMSKEKAKVAYQNLLKSFPSDYSKNYLPFVCEINQAVEKIDFQLKKEGKSRQSYAFDLYFGLELYEILSNEPNFSLRSATKDDTWRYLSTVVIPHIIMSRWGENEERFIGVPRDSRLYLKSIYWYIHLSFQENFENTYESLKNNSTDTIVQLVDRTGKGYNLDLVREIMRQFGKIPLTSGRSDLFRQVMKLNTAWITTIVPDVFDNGNTGYVSALFKEVQHG